MAMTPITAEEIAELRRFIQDVTRGSGVIENIEGGHIALLVSSKIGELTGKAVLALPRLLDEVERSRAAVPTLLTAEEVASVNPYLIRARALLKRIEWSGVSWDEHACPECSGEEPRDRPLDHDIGHRPGCELAALIGAS